MVGLQKISDFLQPVKDGLALKIPGLYGILLELRMVYIGETGNSIETMITEHHQHIHLYHPDSQPRLKIV
jgi:hypothetical protein